MVRVDVPVDMPPFYFLLNLEKVQIVRSFILKIYWKICLYYIAKVK